MQPIAAVNEFVLKFANVNGSGSASANLLVAKAIFRMGLPVAPKNIFPSNIQGLPTWYEVRVSEAGHLARREGVDIFVAMNAQTYAGDVQEIRPGGYLLDDNTFEKPLARADINHIGIPLTRLCNEAFKEPNQRRLLKNIICAGALSALLEIDIEVLKGLIGEQYRRKPQLIDANLEALEIGRRYAVETFACPLGIRLRPSKAAAGKIMIDGNSAAALGAVYGGATVSAWYPITPSSSLAEAFQKYCRQLRVDPATKRNRFAIIQAEDEIAAIGVAVGASWNGARAFTATSGPGVSLMSEFLGLAYFAEIPLVLFDIQRGGPSTGMPTRTQQSDVLAAAYASHGDTKHVLLFPATPRECFDMAADAFDLADRLQTPIIVLSDLDLGMNDWVTEPFAWDDARRYDRGKVLTAEQLDKIARFGRYLDVDGDAIPYRTLPGTHPTKGAFFTRGTSHDEYAVYTEDGRIHARVLDRVRRKFDTAASLVPAPEIEEGRPASRYGVAFYGTTAVAIPETLEVLRARGIRLDTMRIRAFPFASEVGDFVRRHDAVFVVEQNRDAQLRTLLLAEAGLPQEKLVPILSYDGMPVTAEGLADKIEQWLGANLPAREHVAD